MKKKGLMLCVIFGWLLAVQIKASASVTTTGSIQFKERTDPTGGEIHTPDEEDNSQSAPEVIELVEQGSSGEGNLRIQFVPDLRFENIEGIDAKQTVAKVKVLEYSVKGQTTKKKIAPFVQVADERGLIGLAAQWSLQVKASPFTATAEWLPGGQDILRNVQLNLNGSSLTQDYGTAAIAANKIAGQSSAAFIATDEESPATEVLKTNSGQGTNGLSVSNVFHDGYQKDKTSYRDGVTAGIEFVKPAGQAPVKGVAYTSTLTWSLVSGL